ncbi:MAG: 4Fe-4S dicluster domain-containing protein [Chloroflexi bacterium]|nr:4Fe-4S dicluster domain-containing protein [Chloroflexota bacterium]
MNSNGFTRREFLTLVGGATALSISGFILNTQTASADVRPPGALAPYELFRAACVRCGKCVSACPHQSIRQNSERLPYIDGITGWCVFCMDCGVACPTGALHPVDPHTSKLGTAVIDRNRCLPWTLSECHQCYDKCVGLQQAIKLDSQKRPSVDAARCNGCGACVTACPQSNREGRGKEFGKAITLIAG